MAMALVLRTANDSSIDSLKFAGLIALYPPANFCRSVRYGVPQEYGSRQGTGQTNRPLPLCCGMAA